MPNQYVNKVVQSDGTTLIDITDTTSVASDVKQGTYFYLATGEKVQGSAPGNYSVTLSLTGVSSSATGTKVVSGGSYFTEITPTTTGHKINSITVTMGGVDITSQVFKPGVGGKAITANGTYNASSDNLSGYDTVTVNVSGGGSPNLQAKTNISPSTSSQTITPDSGYDGLSSVQINAMPTGTAGTPSASKGTVSNHSVSVTPSVTNTTGYITGGTKTGTAVTVSASELVSGSETKTANGTYDVTNLAELVVNVGGTAAKTKTGTFTGTNTTTVQISCDFAPDLIYVYGSLSGSTSYRGVVSVTIIKNTFMIITNDGSTSSANENLYGVSHSISGDYGATSGPHASYSNNTLTVDMVTSSNSTRFNPNVTYNYKLVKWTA